MIVRVCGHMSGTQQDFKSSVPLWTQRISTKKSGTTATKIRSVRMSTETSDRMNACLAKAAECERRAMLVPDETHRKTYLELARLWRDMAEQVVALDRRLSQEGRQERSRITFRPRSAAR